MKKIINDIEFDLNVEEEEIVIKASSFNKLIFQHSIALKKEKNNFLISKSINNYEILTILSLQNNDNNVEMANIKLYQIKYNLKKIISYFFKEESIKHFYNFINIEHIENILNTIQYQYKHQENYVNEEHYIKLIKELVESISYLLDLLIFFKKDLHILNSNNFIIKNFNKYVVFDSLSKKMTNSLLQPLHIFNDEEKAYQEFNNYKILPLQQIYFLLKDKKLLFIRWDKKINKYLIAYSYNINEDEIKIIKTKHNNNYTYLNNLLKAEEQLNSNNVKFVKIQYVHKYRLLIEKLLIESDLKEIEEDKELIIINSINNEDFDEENEISIGKEDLYNQIMQDKDDIYRHFNAFDKEIEEKLFF